MAKCVSIAGIDKANLTYALWHRSSVAMWFALNGRAPPTLTRDEAQTMGQDCDWSFDYLAGRVMKCNLSGDSVDPWGYDRDNGDGAERSSLLFCRPKERSKRSR
ncbi:hypothetical protein N8T08_005872 [Aspergillus melleus]|uniref:Uncharacterized protein n=1 Tax=Aspergillus melleus TaxID=138277 RepID=A0ACC3B1I4_9EURO|nr:hypothetical protein N8T08_005872 [Aspergillus melleus]